MDEDRLVRGYRRASGRTSTGQAGLIVGPDTRQVHPATIPCYQVSMTIMPPYAPRPVRDAPPPEEAGYEYRLFRVWMLREKQRKVTWWNNCSVDLNTLVLAGEPIERVYRGLDTNSFEAFKTWAGGPGAMAIDLDAHQYACEVIGEVRDTLESRPGSAEFTIEDILLHRFIYRRLRTDIGKAAPDWAPFFFRGGIPLGLAVLDQMLAEQLAEVPWLSWMPGLGHSARKVGRPPVDIFVENIEKRRAMATGPMHIWAMDVTFTGSTAFSNLESALGRISPDSSTPVDVTVAVILPVESNVTKNIRNQPEANRMDLGLKSSDGSPVYVRRPHHPDTVRNFHLRIYPVSRSLTEDVPEALELGYGQPTARGPMYIRTLHQNLTVHVSYGDKRAKVLFQSQGSQERRGDTAHDWFFNESNPKRLRQVLMDLGLPLDPEEATRQVLAGPRWEQFLGDPICLPIT